MGPDRRNRDHRLVLQRLSSWSGWGRCDAPLLHIQTRSRGEGAGFSFYCDGSIAWTSRDRFLVARFNWLTQVPETAQLAYLAIVLLGGGFFCVALLFTLARSDRVRKLPRGIPFRNSIEKFGQALGAYRKHYIPTLIAFAITIVSQLAYYTTYYCAGASLRQSSARTPSFLDIVSIMPLVNTFTAVPISFGGVGVRETLFQHLLGHLSGVPEPIAVLTASLGFTIQAMCGLLGGAIYLVWRPRRPLQMRKTVRLRN
ncbi:MAG: hypothetical protein DME86_09750 [Verrucomicrobia bacterium]|nr:MAG: hypothetical protein DME86_09750 [Verrucomicrobiota bacterium]